jgi:hypothetical protein
LSFFSFSSFFGSHLYGFLTLVSSILRRKLIILESKTSTFWVVKRANLLFHEMISGKGPVNVKHVAFMM